MVNAVEIEYLLPRSVLEVSGSADWRTDQRTGRRVRSSVAFEVATALEADPAEDAARTLALPPGLVWDRSFTLELTEDQRLQGAEADCSTPVRGASPTGVDLPARLASAGALARTDDPGAEAEFGPDAAVAAAYSMAHPEVADQRTELRAQVAQLQEMQLRLGRRIASGDTSVTLQLHEVSVALADLAPLTASLDAHFAAYVERFERAETQSGRFRVPVDALPRMRSGSEPEVLEVGSDPALTGLLDTLGLALVVLDDDRAPETRPQLPADAEREATVLTPLPSAVKAEALGATTMRVLAPSNLTYRVPRPVTVLVYQLEPATGDLWLEQRFELLICDRFCEQRALNFSESSWGQRVASYTFGPSGALVGMRVGIRAGVDRLPVAPPAAALREHAVPPALPAVSASSSATPAEIADVPVQRGRIELPLTQTT